MAERKKTPPSSTEGSRKRRRDQDREKLQQYGVDLPEIPGLPVTIIPLHTFALKQTLASIKTDFSDKTLSPCEGDTSEDDVGNGIGTPVRRTARSLESSGDSLVASLVNRVEQAAATEELDSEKEREMRQRNKQRQEAIESWLASIYKEIRDCRKGSDSISKIPVAAIKHLWEMAIDDHRVSVRRACLFMAGNLLKKSSDARKWLLEDTTFLAAWVNVLVENHSEGETRERALLHHRLWQCEGFLWMKALCADGSYGDLYPRLCVAMQRIQQRCPWVLETDASSLSVHTQNLQTWRSCRDLAVEHCEEEMRRVKRLLKQCSACFDILAPGVVDVLKDPSEASKNDVDSSEEHEDDVDWEDGWDGEDGNMAAKTQAESHKEAVERTLTAMQATTRVFENGKLEIDMSANRLNDDGQPADPEAAQKARQKLSICIKILNQRHLARLSQWIDGLTKADSLALNKDGALVQLDNGLRQKRKHALEISIELKSLITSTLSSARRFEAPGTAASGNQQSKEVKDSWSGVSTRGCSNQSLILKKHHKGQSGRIRIKYKNV